MKHVLIKLITLATCVVALCFVVQLVYIQYVDIPYPKPANILPKPPLAPADQYQLVVLGNSHVESGLVLYGYQLPALNMGGVAQRFNFDLALLKHYRRQLADDAVVVINVSPISFSHRPADKNDGLQYNYYGRVSPFFIPHLLISDYLQLQLLPVLRSGYDLRKEYAQRVSDRRAAEEKWEEDLPEIQTATSSTDTQSAPQPTTVLSTEPGKYFMNVNAINQELAQPRPGNVEKLQENSYYVYGKWYESEEFSTQHFEHNRQDLAELLDYVEEQGWTPVLITIPISDILLKTLHDDYLETYLYQNLQQVDTQGVEYIDFSQESSISAQPALFSNADHLNDDGEQIFSYVLLRSLIDRGYIPESADGYSYGPLYVPVDSL